MEATPDQLLVAGLYASTVSFTKGPPSGLAPPMAKIVPSGRATAASSERTGGMLAPADVIDTAIGARGSRQGTAGGGHGGDRGPTVAAGVVGLHAAESEVVMIFSANGIDVAIGARGGRQERTGGGHGGDRGP